MTEEVKPSELWCKVEHQDDFKSYDLLECKLCGNWATKLEISYFGCCFVCDKRKN